MPNRTFQLDIVTPERRAYSQEVESLVVMGSDGYLGVLGGHAPLMTLVGVGEIRITEPNGARVTLASGGGFMEVGPERTVVLVESAERASEISVERAQAAAERARQRLASQHGPEEIDVMRAEAALSRALNRLKVAGQA